MQAEKIKQFAKTIGIDKVGIVSLDKCKTIDANYDKKKIIDSGKSVIVCMANYYFGKTNSNISKYARGKDYHLVLKQKLEIISSFISENEQEYIGKCFVDVSPFDERYLAYLAGLGFYGENGFIINDEYGTYSFICEIVTNLEFEKDTPKEQKCYSCGNCINKCPNNALQGNGRLHHNKCLSYITQKKGELSEDEIALLKANKMVWGCDICQDVCWHNKNVKKASIEDFSDCVDEIEIDEQMSNAEFKKKYGDRAFSWRGKKVLLRNIEILRNK